MSYAALALTVAAFHAEAGEPLPKVRVARDGRTFETADGRAFVPFGLSYFRPGTGWAPQLWKQFDADATRRDFARMRDLGVNCVRVFLSYGSFLQESNKLSAEGLAKFDQFLSIAEDVGIYMHPTGADHWEGTPVWAHADRYADDGMLAAQELFWRELAARYRGRPVIFAYDLLNEPMVAWDTPPLRVKWNAWLAAHYDNAAALAHVWNVPPDRITWSAVPPPEAKDAPRSRRLLDYQRFREDIADEWTRRQAVAIKSADPQALVTVGFIQWSVPSLLPVISHHAAFRPARQAPWLDFLEVHFYPLENGFYEYTGADAEAGNLAYLEGVVREVSAPGKPVVLAEFGWYGGGKLTFDQGRHAAATEEQQARWCRRAVEVTRGFACGWLNWGLYDHPEAGDCTQFSGLLTHDGREKAWGREFRRLAQERVELRKAPAATRPELDWDLAITSTRGGNEFRASYLKAWKSDPRNAASP